MAAFGKIPVRTSPITQPRVFAMGLATLASGEFLATAGCNGVKPPPEAPVSSQATQPGGWGVEVRNIGKSIQPGNDFYRYVNKGWLDTAKIPAGLPYLDSFAEVTLSTEQQLESLIRELLGKTLTPGTPEQHVADLYRSYLDTQGRNQRGIERLRGELDGILKARDRRELAARMGRIGYDPLFSVNPMVDWGNPSRYILGVFQAGLGLPSRDYYLKEGEPFVGHRAAYLAYIEGGITTGGNRPGSTAG